MPQDLYAFWRYDQFPYVLHGRVVHMADDGTVRVQGYQTMRFKPILLLPVGSGEELGAKINAVRSEHQVELDKLNESFKDQVRELLDPHDATMRVPSLRRK
jgi:hypothetical protein